MEGLFGIARLPDWIRYPGGLAVAYAVSVGTLVLSGTVAYYYAEIIGAALIGLLVFIISEIQRGVHKAWATLRG
jgi:hypothetical protein